MNDSEQTRGGWCAGAAMCAFSAFVFCSLVLWGYAFVAGLLSGCTSAPMLERGAVPVSIEPTTTLHVDPQAVQGSITVEPGAVVVTVEVPVDKAAEAIVPTLERVSAAAIKAARIEGNQAQQKLERIVIACALGLAAFLVLVWWIGRRWTLDDVAKARSHLQQPPRPR